MIYFALLWIAVISLSVGSKSPSAGIAVAIVGTASCFLARAWVRWSSARKAEVWNRQIKDREQERSRRMQLDMERSGIMVITDETVPLAYLASTDAVIASEDSEYGIVRAGDFFFLTSRAPTDAEILLVRDYIEFHYNSRTTEAALKPIRLFQPSPQAVHIEEEQKRLKRAERDRILNARLVDVENRKKVDLGPNACSLYIMSSRAATKIGISNSPGDRLRQVQTGHPASLELHKIWWFQSTADAAALEKVVHGQLKVRGAHRSGEWFGVSVLEATTVISDAIKHLAASGEIDKGLLPPIDVPLNNLELTLGRLLNLKWSISRKGNEYLRLPGNAITVFRRKQRWSYSRNEVFSEEQFPTKEAAKLAALQQVLSSVH